MSTEIFLVAVEVPKNRRMSANDIVAAKMTVREWHVAWSLPWRKLWWFSPESG